MTRTASFFLPFAILIIFLTGCTNGADAPKYPVARLDRAIASYSCLDPHQRQALCDSLRPELEALAALTGDTLSDAMLEAWSGSTSVEYFQPAVDSIFPDLDDIERDIMAFYDASEKKSLSLPRYRIAAVTWPSYQPMALRDSVVFIALNHYLGPCYPAYSDFEQYQRALKDPGRVPYDVASGIIRSTYPYGSTTERLFERMLYEGAVAHVQMQLLNNPRLDYALGLTPEQMAYFADAEGRLWKEFGLRRGLLYSTDPEAIRDVMDIGARSTFDGGAAPGGVGRYIGYRILESYLGVHPDKTLAEILTTPVYGSAITLVESAYVPATREPSR